MACVSSMASRLPRRNCIRLCTCKTAAEQVPAAPLPSTSLALRKAKLAGPSLQCGAQVDVIVSTIGFPLVGGPAGTMEGGRQAEIAQGILASKNVPYFVAAPLLIQVRNGSRCSSLMYALPRRLQDEVVHGTRVTA